jgi:hypothetical protein
VLTFTLSVQRFKAIARRRGQIGQLCCRTQLPELSKRDPLDGPKAPYGTTLVKPSCVAVRDGLNHRSIITR